MAAPDGPDAPRARVRSWEPRFLEELARTCNVTVAARAAGVARSTVYEARGGDEAFAERWADAEAEGADLLEEEARRRGVDGWDEPVWHKGAQVGAVRRYDPRLLELLLRAHKPETFRSNVKHEHGGTVGVRLDELIRQAEQE